MFERFVADARRVALEANSVAAGLGSPTVEAEHLLVSLASGDDPAGHALREAGLGLGDFARLFVHQATLPYLDEMCAATGIPRDRVEVTVDGLGNMASASLPVAYARAGARGGRRGGPRALDRAGERDRPLCAGLRDCVFDQPGNRHDTAASRRRCGAGTRGRRRAVYRGLLSVKSPLCVRGGDAIE